MSSVKDKTLRGIKWNLVEQVVVYTTVFIGTVILSRILLPDQFGLYGMIMVAGNLANVLINMGLSYSVIQNAGLSKEDLSSIFWFNILLGFLFAGIFFATSGFLASFYHQAELKNLGRVFCVSLIPLSANFVPLGILIRSLQFKQLALSNIAGNVLAYIVSISMALAGYGVWALVVHFIVLYSTITALNLHFSGWWPLPVFQIQSMQKVKKFSANLTGSQLIDFVANNLDTVLIGKYFGKRDLGLFGRATALVMIPVTSLGYVLNRTLFPLFSELQNDPKNLSHRYQQSLRLLIMIIMPILILLGVLAEETILLLFGEQWIGSAFYISLLSVYASIQCINAFNDSFMLSQGRSDLLFRLSVIEKSMLVGAVAAGIQFGISGVIFAKVAVLAVLFLPRVWIISRVLKLSLYQWLVNIIPVLAGLLVLTLVAFSGKWFLSGFSFLSRLIMVSITASVAYYLYLRVTRNDSLSELQRIVQNQWQAFFQPK